MVMIICFSEDACQAIFDASEFHSYDQCMTQAVPVARYMKDVYSNSNGEIHCLNENEMAQYKLFIENGGKPELSMTHPSRSDSQI